MKLAKLLTNEQIILEMYSKEHIEAIDELVNHLDARGFLDGIDKQEIMDGLHAREDQISTGIGCGVAIPHVFSENVDRVVTAFGRSKEGVDFEALDNAPVKFVILFIVPKADYHKHLQTLSAIAKLFNNCEVRQQLADAETREQILEIFASRPSRTQAERPC